MNDFRDSRSIERDLRQACSEVVTLTRMGELNPAQKVIAKFSHLSTDEEAVIEILYAEFMALDELGRRPGVAEWLDRFPEHRQRLERLLQLHELFAEEDNQPNAKADRQWESSSPFKSPEIEATTLSDKSNFAAPLANTNNHDQEATLNRQIGSYELIQEVGRGGMGIVYRAHQIGLSRTVALKVLRSVDARPEQLVRFQREAEAIAALQHPNIVQVYEVGTDGDEEFLSMEFVEGGGLEHHIYDRVWSNHEIASLIKTLADAMHYAHQLGIIHRDLKPANVLLSDQGQPKIVDFGLAKRFQDASNFRTNTGTLIGTPCYMSPEQAVGTSDSIGPATDVFSLGVVLYELLTRQLPFLGSTTVETLHLIAEREPILPSKLSRHIPRDLETICLKCLAKLPSQRYASAGALAEDLGRFLDHRPILARRSTIIERMQRIIIRHPQLAILIIVMAVVAIGVTSIITWQQRTMASITRQVERQAESERRERTRAAKAEAAYEASLHQARELVGRWTQLGLTLDNEPGMDSVRRKAFEDAVAYYEQFLKNNEGDPAIHREAAQASLRAAVIHIELGLWKEAETGLRRTDSWLSELNQDAEILWQRSDCLIQLGHVLRRLERWSDSESAYLQAIEIMHVLLKLAPDNTRYLIRLANAKVNISVVYGTQQRWKECIANYVDALSMDLYAAEIRSGRASRSEPQSDEQITMEQRVEREIARSRQLRLSLQANDPAKLTILARENFLPEIGLCLDDLGDTMYRSGRFDFAETCFREAVEHRQLSVNLAPQNRRIEQYLARSQTRLGMVLLETDRVAEASQVLGSASDKYSVLTRDFPERHDYKGEWSTCLVQLSRSQTQNRQRDAAIKSAVQAVSIQEQLVASSPAISYLKDSLAEGLLALGQAHQEEGKMNEAAQQYQRAMDVAPTNPSPANNYAWMLVNHPRSTAVDYQKAAELSEKAIQLQPNNHHLWNTHALTLFRTKRFSEAAMAIDRSIELGEGGTIADWLIKSLILQGLGNHAEAQQWFQQAETRRQAESPLSTELRRFSEEAQRALLGSNM